ncbi:MAG: AAA family ATPase [Erysipelotrichaceae bacterium]|nr:AAA family ATPase [Erysipelotrichaceae bacterium]
MSVYTQEELLNTEFKNVEHGILGGLLKNGLYIMGANSKIGKSMIATSLANAVADGTEYLGKQNLKGKVIYYDNDNYAHETQARLKALELGSNPNIHYVFGDDAQSLQDIKMDLEQRIENCEEYSLVIIDSFGLLTLN